MQDADYNLFYRTSGANDNIFIYSFSLNSLATGPKIRVPFGVPSSLIITAAFSSNFIYEPSALLNPLLDLTITAFTTSPFFTTPPGVADLTEATITWAS